MNPTEARKRIVQTYRQTGNSCKTARRGNTSPQRVRKGVQRYQQHGEAGLLDQPKTPKRQPRKTPPEIEPRVLAAPVWGEMTLQTDWGKQGAGLIPTR
jgi:transposase-like protein